MFYYQGYTCPMCQKAFIEGEDIVSCPKCGLPHHRTCWQIEGKCHLDKFHDTEQQWSKHTTTENHTQTYEKTSSDTVKVCPHCRAENLQYAEFCATCGSPLQTEEWGQSKQCQSHYFEYRPFRSPFSTCSPEETIGRHCAKDLEAIVGNNSLYYLPRFRQVAKTGSGGWNWAAFFFGPYWLLYRKNYLLGILYFIIQTIYTFASNYILFPIQQAATTDEIITAAEALLENELTRWMLLPIFILSVILLTVKVLLGVHGNRLYLYTCGKRIDKARRADGTISTADLNARGGVSMLAAVIAYVIPVIVSYILAGLNFM